jgi:hypothetical protein
LLDDRIVLALLEARVDPGQRPIPPLLELEIGTATSREMASTGSPRNSRSTTSFFRPADQRFTSTAAPGSPPVALRAPSSEPGATPLPSLLFNISHSVFQTRFNPKSVSRKIGAGALTGTGKGLECRGRADRHIRKVH